MSNKLPHVFGKFSFNFKFYLLWVKLCPLNRYLQVLTSNTCGCDLTWKMGLCRYNQIKMRSWNYLIYLLRVLNFVVTLKEMLLLKISSLKLTKKNTPRYWPLVSCFPDQKINVASSRLLDTHSTWHIKPKVLGNPPEVTNFRDVQHLPKMMEQIMDLRSGQLLLKMMKQGASSYSSTIFWFSFTHLHNVACDSTLTVSKIKH